VRRLGGSFSSWLTDEPYFRYCGNAQIPLRGLKYVPSPAQVLSKSVPYGRLLHAQPRNLNDENFHLRYLHRLQRRHLLHPRAPGRDNDVYTRCVRKEIVEIDARCSAPLKITNKAPALTMKLTLDHSLVRLFLSVQRLSKTVMRSAIRSGASTSRLRRCIGKH
jgi:hypothetical protein